MLIHINGIENAHRQMIYTYLCLEKFRDDYTNAYDDDNKYNNVFIVFIFLIYILLHRQWKIRK